MKKQKLTSYSKKLIKSEVPITFLPAKTLKALKTPPTPYKDDNAFKALTKLKIKVQQSENTVNTEELEVEIKSLKHIINNYEKEANNLKCYLEELNSEKSTMQTLINQQTEKIASLEMAIKENNLKSEQKNAEENSELTRANRKLSEYERILEKLFAQKLKEEENMALLSERLFELEGRIKLFIRVKPPLANAESYKSKDKAFKSLFNELISNSKKGGFISFELNGKEVDMNQLPEPGELLHSSSGLKSSQIKSNQGSDEKSYPSNTKPTEQLTYTLEAKKEYSHAVSLEQTERNADLSKLELLSELSNSISRTSSFANPSTFSIINSTTQESIRLEADRVFFTGSNMDIFLSMKEFVMSALNGFNVSIFAYGQTNSGKTHTLLGPKSERGLGSEEGLLQITLKYLLERALERKLEANRDLDVGVSIIEIYNERLSDLMRELHRETPRAEDENNKKECVNSRKPRFCPIIKNLFSTDFLNETGEKERRSKFLYGKGPARHIEFIKSKQEEIKTLINKALANRQTASTAMNKDSSRSHTIVQFSLSEHVPGNSPKRTTKKSTLSFIDLAGSERAAKTGTEGDRLREANYINNSLTSLNLVIQAIKDKKNHVPYRNSKLTSFLEESLGGDSKTLFIVNLSSEEENRKETENTLRFAQRVGNISGKIIGKNF